MRSIAVQVIFLLLIPNAAFSADYYWIGGTGNWSDISHWATTSGGVITHNQVPTADDNVYFDANSFSGPGQVVAINNENIFCKNMDWTGATGTPVFRGDAGKVINIFGSLNFITDMTFDFAGQVRFRAATTDTPLETAGHHMGNSVFFIGDGGWVLQDSIVVDSLIQLNDGHLNTNDHNLETDYFYVDIQNNGLLTLGNSKITIHGSNIYRIINDDFFAFFVMQIWANDRPFSINPGNSLIEFTASEVQFDIQANSPLNFNDVYFSKADGLCNLSLFFHFPVQFGELKFNSNGALSGNIGAENLVLAPGKFYTFLASNTYSFDQITANGTCLATITLQGNEVNLVQTANFQSDGQNIILDYVNLKNISATGSSSFVANNSVDLGNNDGWTINSRAVQNLYWVGGSGSWNDPGHWSLTSGGPGGACIPSGTDNVFFNANSFTAPDQRVVIDSENVFCRDMTWTGAGFFPALEGGYDPVLHIFGSLTLIENMSYNFGGLLNFESQETGNTITTGNHLLNKIEFLSSQGEWTLLDSFKSETFIFLNAGTLITNDQYVECTEFSNGNFGLFRRLELGNSHWVIKHFPGARKDIWHADLGEFELDAGTSTIEFTGIGGHFEHFGEGDINYHRLVFNNEVGFLTNLSPGINCTIDSLQFNHGGYIQSDFTINTLGLSPGFTYLLKENTTQTLGQIVAPGNCNALISLRSDAAGNAAFLHATNTQTDLQYLSLRDVHSIGPGALAAQNSIDLGNNQGWTIDELGNRTLYWVGGTGNWADPAHWSLSSGGPGGECIPTLRDDVFFDLNSFNAAGQEVQGQELNGYYCRNITWENNLPNPIFSLNRLYTHGSAQFSPNMVNQLSHFHMSGTGPQTVRFNDRLFQDVYLDGNGTYTFRDQLSARQLFLRSGNLNTNSQSLDLGRLEMENENTLLDLTFGNSYMAIKDAFDATNYSLEAPYGANTTINAGNSVIELTNSRAAVYLSGGLSFNNMIFSGTDGLLQIYHPFNSSSINNPARFNLLEMGGDAIIKGYHSIDTLIFAPGKSYQFEFNVTQTINEHFQILGNNCNPIELFSTQAGEKATVFMASGTINGNFIQMRDQIGTGGATFFAGTHSTDIDNSNQGWIFESSPEFIDVGFFGEDRTICQGDVLSLSAYNYSQGETYEWSTGSTEATISVTESNTYWAKVTFGNMCEILDTITISTIEPASVNLGPDTTLCAGESLLLDATSQSPGVTYIWQDGSTQPTFELLQAGNFFVELNKEDCITSDTIIVQLVEAPAIDLGPDQTLCDGQSITLDASTGQAETYLWQDNSTNPTLPVNQSGNYSVQVTANGCTGQDEINIAFNPIPTFSLGPDTSLCSGQSTTFDFTGLADNYQWQDGSTSSSYTINQAGEFWLQVTADNCSFADTIQVALFQTPTVDLGPDQSLCDGQSINLDASSPQVETYLWQDNSTNPILPVNQSGNYSVQVTANGCTGQDEINITFNPIPSFSLGPDTSLCSGQSTTFDFTGLADNYQWQDGSTSSSYTINQAGEFWLQVTADNCSFADTIQVALFQTPTVDLGPDQSLCDGQSITLDASTGQAETYLWQNNSTNPTLPVNQSGNYSVQVTANGCTGQDEINITFNPIPSFSLGPDTSLCSGQSTTFDFTGLADNYQWQDGSTSSSYTINQAGEFWLQVTANNCSFADTISVSLQTSPTVDLGADKTACQDEIVLLEAVLSENDGFSWQDGSSSLSFEANQAGIYWLEAVLGNCRSRDSVLVDIRPPLDLGLPDTLRLCSGELQILRPKIPSGSVIQWQDGSDRPEYRVDKAGVYSLSVDDGACVSEAIVNVFASSCGKIQVFIPNAFSPNEDGINDLFSPNFDPDYQILDYQIKIFDRWGSQVFSSLDLTESWAGMVRGREANLGVYVYMLEFTFEDQGEIFNQRVSGDVTLVR